MNEDVDKEYEFDCNNTTSALLSPFDQGTTVKNLLYPYESVILSASTQKLGMRVLDSSSINTDHSFPGLENSTDFNGCLTKLPMTAFGYKAYVPIEKWLRPSPAITHFSPGHDHRLLSNSSRDEQSTVLIELHFSDEMNCINVVNAMSTSSTTEDGSVASLDKDSVKCQIEHDTKTSVSPYTGSITGQIPSSWKLTAKLVNVSDGVHSVTISNATTEQGNASTSVSDLSSRF